MLVNALARICFGLLGFVRGQVLNACVFAWDGLLQLGNVVSSKRQPGSVIRAGWPGYGGLWPPFEPPGKGDSRSPCPALNALANHGILPRSGRGILLKAATQAVERTYNVSPTFAYFTMNYVADMLQREYAADAFDLGDLAVHNGIAHDASITRRDAVHQPDKGAPDQQLVDALLACASGTDGRGHAVLTVADLARFSAEQRAHSRATNGQFTMSFAHKLFGSTNAATLLAVFGGRVDDLAIVLKEERIPEGWEPRDRTRNGVTLASINATVFSIELSIPERHTIRVA